MAKNRVKPVGKKRRQIIRKRYNALQKALVESMSNSSRYHELGDVGAFSNYQRDIIQRAYSRKGRMNRGVQFVTGPRGAEFAKIVSFSGKRR